MYHDIRLVSRFILPRRNNRACIEITARRQCRLKLVDRKSLNRLMGIPRNRAEHHQEMPRINERSYFDRSKWDDATDSRHQISFAPRKFSRRL